MSDKHTNKNPKIEIILCFHVTVYFLFKTGNFTTLNR